MSTINSYSTLPKIKPGREKIPVKLRKEVLSTYGHLVRGLDKMGLGDQSRVHMEAILELIKGTA